MDAIERGKGQLVEALPATGTAILNADDGRVRRMSRRTRARVMTYGFAEEADVTAQAVVSLGWEGMRFVLRLPGHVERAVRVPVLGRHGVESLGGAGNVEALARGHDATHLHRGLHLAVTVAAGIDAQADLAIGEVDDVARLHRIGKPRPADRQPVRITGLG